MVGECKNKRLSSVLFHVFSCLLGFIMIYPLLWLLASSFKSNDTMFHNTYSLIPETWDVVQNYLSGLAGVAGYSFMHFFKNSVIVTLVSVVTSIFSSLLAAYALARVKFRGSGFWFGCVIMTMMIPSQVMVVPQYIILRALHLNDTLAAIVACCGKADLLVLLSDIDGLYTANPHTHPDAKLIPLVREITPAVMALADGAGSALGTGGMATKLRAARMVTGSVADMVSANGAHPELLYDIAAGKPAGTRFTGHKED